MSDIKTGIPIKYNENSIFAKWQMKILKKKALNAYIQTGRTHYIIPYGTMYIMIIDNKRRKELNKTFKNDKLSYKRLIEIAFFSTPTGNRIIS